jgi:hypothetical protein
MSAVLVVIDVPFALGLYVRYASHLELFSSFFGCALDVYCPHTRIGDLLENNPGVGKLLTGDALDHVEMERYDTVLVYSAAEEKYHDYFGTQRRIQNLERFYSILAWPFTDVVAAKRSFPLHEPLLAYLRQATFDKHGHLLPNRIYLTQAEKAWGEAFLRDSGVAADEPLVVVLDEASHRDRVLRHSEHFALVRHFLSFARARLLFFDHKRIGKSGIYRAVLGASAAQRMIFAEGLPLRRELSLLGSRFCRVVFGPGSGLLHCAAGLFSDAPPAPLLLGYVGDFKYEKYDEWYWWGNTQVNMMFKTDAGLTFFNRERGPAEYQKARILGCHQLRCTEIAGLMQTQFAAQLRALSA